MADRPMIHVQGTILNLDGTMLPQSAAVTATVYRSAAGDAVIAPVGDPGTGDAAYVRLSDVLTGDADGGFTLSVVWAPGVTYRVAGPFHPDRLLICDAYSAGAVVDFAALPLIPLDEVPVDEPTLATVVAAIDGKIAAQVPPAVAAEVSAEMADTGSAGYAAVSGVAEMRAADVANTTVAAVKAERGLSVKDYGAAGDGVTDDGPAFDMWLTALNGAPGTQGIRGVIPAGRYNLPAGASVPITRSHVSIEGAGSGASQVLCSAGTIFAFGNGASPVIGGGVRDIGFIYPGTPAPASRVLLFDKSSSQKIKGIYCDNVRQLAKIGVDSTRTAGGISFAEIFGATDPSAGSIVFDAVAGAGLNMENVLLNAKGVGYPTDATSAHPAQDTTFLRVGTGSFDTITATRVITNRYGRGLDIQTSGAFALVNFWFTDCIFDYSKTNGIRVRTNASGSTIRNIWFNHCWAVATDGRSVEVQGTLGSIVGIRFNECVARQAGKSNWWFGSGAGLTDKITLNNCTSWGANRLSGSNTSTDQDDLVIMMTGVRVRGGSYGEEATSIFGFPYQGRYGVAIGADLDTQFVDAQVEGATGGFNIWENTTNTLARQRLITRNRRTTAGELPSYATTTAVIPVSNTLATHLAATLDTLYIYGGSISSIQQNGAEIATSGPATLILRPGDTWKVIYSATPNIKRVVAP